jgi:putative RNase toxin 44 of polymorphic toxin system
MLRVACNQTDNKSASIKRDLRMSTEGVARLYNTMHRNSLLEQLAKREFNIEGFSSLLPDRIPPGIDIKSDIDTAQNMFMIKFINSFRNRHLWDFKPLGREYANYGNWHFGFLLAARGIYLEIGQIGAGLYQIIMKNYKEGTPILTYPYGDDPDDQTWIILGYLAYKMYEQDKTYFTTPKIQIDFNLRLIVPNFDQSPK